MPPLLRPCVHHGRPSSRGRLRGLLAGLALTALVAPSGLALSSPAAAKDAVVERSSDAYVCTGYSGCEAAGYSTSGYRDHSSTMYWQMYSGHNCTNYVAYRMVKAGLPNSRPWSGSGNASNWGVALASKTNQTPTVGAVAWWRANVPGAGSAGHVAYVEKVVSDSEIIVSEDSYGGDFHWHRYTKSGAWPSGFIHLADGADTTISNTEAPVVTGEPRVGSALRASKGTWSPRVDAAYQWKSDGRALRGATARTYTPTRHQLGKALSVTVTGSRTDYTSAVATSAPTAVIRRGRFTVAADPVVSGEPEVGQTLTASRGEVRPTPGTTSVQWYAAGEPVRGATAWSFTPTDAELGGRIRAEVTARSPGFAPARARSEATSRVLRPQVGVAEPATLDGTPLVGSTLTADPGVFAPARASVRYIWLRDDEPVAGADQATYDLGGVDLGAVMSVRVDLTSDGYRRVQQTLALDGPVLTEPEVQVVAVGREHRAVVRLHVRAPGVESPAGEATVRVGRQVLPVDVVDGLARVVVRGIAPGPRAVHVHYLGDETVLPASVDAAVRVLRGVHDRAPVGRSGTRHYDAGRAGE